MTYRQACDIADILTGRGLPVVSQDSVAGEIVIRFGGPRPQEIHADASGASADGIERAYHGYEADPGWSRR